VTLCSCCFGPVRLDSRQPSFMEVRMRLVVVVLAASVMLVPVVAIGPER
jgi:hypothetical protein